MCFSKKQKKVLGRWSEGIGIGLISGAIVTFSIKGWKYWYFVVVGFVFLICGTALTLDMDK